MYTKTACQEQIRQLISLWWHGLADRNISASNRSYLRAGDVEVSERLECIGFLVEGDDVLDDVCISGPVQRLQVVGCHHVDDLLTRRMRVEHDLLSVAGLQQSFHCLQPINQNCLNTRAISMLIVQV